jgi:quinate dehydrogenase
MPVTTKKASDGQDELLSSSYQYGSSPLSPTSLNTPHRTFLIGNPISHSLAPLLHNTLFSSLNIPWNYSLLESPTSAPFHDALHQPDVIGCAVTMPYKVELSTAVDHLTPEARTLGAINTVFLRKDAASGKTVYVGTNTDTFGIRESFLRNIPNVLEQSKGKPGLIIGGGGAARSAVYALWRWLGCSKIYMINRLESEVDAIRQSFETAQQDSAPEDKVCPIIYVNSLSEASSVEVPMLVVGTIPDFPPVEENEKLAASCAETVMKRRAELGEGKGYVLEMCYHPRIRTSFYELSEREGWAVIPGTEAMIYQGVAQQVLWAEIPLDRIPLTEARNKVNEALVKHH